MIEQMRDKLRAICERTPWSPPFSIVSSEAMFGIVLFLLIIATIVFMPAQSYRFWYGQQF